MIRKVSLLNTQWLRIIAAIITGAIGTLSFSPFNIWLCALVSLIGLLCLALNRNTIQSAVIGFFWGIGLFGTGVNWIYVSVSHYGGLPLPVNLFLVILLVLYLSLYPALFSALLARFWPRATLWRLAFASPVLWQCCEFLRSIIITGFPWLKFGYSQIDGPLKGIAPLFGVDMITFVLVLISGLLVFAYQRKRFIPLLLAFIILFAPWPLRHIHWYQTESRKITVAMIQGNIEQSLKWEPHQLETILNTYLLASKPYLHKADIIIWPESAIPEVEINMENFLSQFDSLLRQNHTALITGIIDAQRTANTTKYYNTAIVLGNNEPYHYPTKDRYNKHHLVPFGEYVPLEWLLRPLAPIFNLPMSSLSSGDYQQSPLTIHGYQFTTAICYEIILGEQVRANFHPTTDFLLTISNDAWFGHSIGPWQHFQMARMRALELGRPLLRATNNGITAIISPSGNVEHILPQFERNVLDATISPTKGMTPYARIGSIGTWLISVIFIIIAIINRRYKYIRNIFK